MKHIFTHFLSVLLVTAATGIVRSQSNNIRPDSVLSPPAKTPLAVSVDLTFRLTNTGQAEQNVPLGAFIWDPSGALFYRDTIIIPFWPSGTEIDTTFPQRFTPTVTGKCRICGIASFPDDPNRSNISTCAEVLALPLYDAAADSVVNPQPNEVKELGSTWQPIALFSAVGLSDMFDVPAKVVIHRDSARGGIVFVSDTTITALNIDQGLVAQSFRPDLGPYHISSLPVGHYMLAAFVDFGGDGNRLNDTAWTPFSIGSSSVHDVGFSDRIGVFLQPGSRNLSLVNLPPNIERILISNVLGQPAIDYQYPMQSSLTLDISSLPSGLYYIEVRSREQIYHQRLIVSH